ncbi:hypothetical protein KI387_014126, partial [Taxus chinensis]
ISTHTTAIISPTVSAPLSTTDLPIEAPLTPTSSTHPTNILDAIIQHGNTNINDSNDEVDTIELIDETLGKLNFTPIDIDASYFNDIFMVDGH